MRPFRLSLIALLAAIPLRAEETWRVRLEAVIARAVAQNPSVAERESRIEAARHRIGQAGALPAPEVEFGLQDVPISPVSLSADDFTMEKVTARQAFPAAGKRPARERSAEAEFEALTAMHADHVLGLAADAADAFFGLADLDARIEILERSRERLRRSAASATERYRVGKGAQADVLRANLEVTASEERLAGLRGDRRKTAARLNALQGLPAASPIDPVPLPDADPSPPSPAALLEQVEARSPAVLAAAAEVRKAEEQLTLARLERRPDFLGSAYYANRIDFPNFFGASVSLTLPFFQPRRLKELEAEREADLSAARANLAAIRNEIRRGVEEASADLERSREQVSLFRGSILPQAETNAGAAEEAYRVGQIDFLTLVRSALDLDTYQSELSVRRAGAWRALAALQKASGLALLPGTPAAEGDIHVQK
jgi:outer membrane protein TolC